MSSSILELAIADAIQHGKALLKFISPNDVGTTGSHQTGYYLPKKAAHLFTPYPADKGQNHDHPVKIFWQDGRETESMVKWYGKGTRSEYRITRFGRDFPFLAPDCIGDLLVLVPQDESIIHGYDLDRDDDIEELQAALGVDVIGTWALYDASAPPSPESEEECIHGHYAEFSRGLTSFPSTSQFSERARMAILECLPNITGKKTDVQLIRYLESEYALFRIVERLLCQNEITRLFKDVDDFIKTAAKLMNRRKSRAGRSLENHVEFILRKNSVPFDMRPDIDGKPDIVIPGKAQYDDNSYPTSKLFIVGVKTTCKDRWRQVLNEAKRIPHKHILTTQAGISKNQLIEMHKSKVSLIVPELIQKQYPADSGIKLLSLDGFISFIHGVIPQS